MNMKKTFELYCHMNDNETRGSNYKTDDGIELSPRQQEKVLRGNIQAFIHKTGAKTTDGLIQAFTGSADLPILTKDVFNVTNQVPNYDLAWQDAFRGIALSKGQLSWEIATVKNEASFKMIAEGGKVGFERYVGDKLTASIAKYGMGIGLTWETVEGRKLYQFVEQMEHVRAALYGLWADVHYGLMAVAGATNPITWQGVTADAVVDRDVMTINKGYETLGSVNKDKGYGDTANLEMLIYASPSLKARINRALRLTDQTDNNNAQVIEYNVAARYSWNSSLPSGKALMVIPGNKMQNSVYLQELSLAKQDMESLNELRSYWTAFGATVADSDQVYELAFS